MAGSIAKQKSAAAALDAPLNQNGTNHLLLLLPPNERERVLALCEAQTLEIETVLYKAGGSMDHVYFPLSSMVSLVIDSEDGGTIEVGVVGNEGLVGTPIALGGTTSHVRAVIQVAGKILRMKTKDFRVELERSTRFVDLVQRFAQALTVQISQSVMCNRLHSVEERTCRWILMAHDRAGTDKLHLTQAFLAEMLGIRRPSVTVAAGMLHKAGLISYSRGILTILDRPRLEEAACECYAVVDRELHALLH
jgi:CRP-like cAMP-binding protein